MFRKEAIFRRMKYYSRESERCQSRIAELERQKSRCEAGLAAMETCWQQVEKTSTAYTFDHQLICLQSLLMSLGPWYNQNNFRQFN